MNRRKFIKVLCVSSMTILPLALLKQNKVEAKQVDFVKLSVELDGKIIADVVEKAKEDILEKIRITSAKQARELALRNGYQRRLEKRGIYK